MRNRKEDFMKTLPTKIDPKYSNMTSDQLERFEDMLNKLRPVYDQVNATHLLKHEHIDKIFRVSEEVTDINLDWMREYFDNPLLKVFHDKNRWHLLHLVIQASATHQLVYKQNLAYEMKVSVKTVYELIQEFIASGHFVELPPTNFVDRKKVDKRVVNIRPSVDVTIAYLDVNFKHILQCIKFLRMHSKITFDFNR